ncbi:MAG: DUF92 domain-containing protein [Bacteroidota bacterium]|nr:DUF92 domain-containing protein [Bacteroidota bacterium]MDP4236670.1 DUF92 domain-containing protein [Bacteroidota bacterium]
MNFIQSPEGFVLLAFLAALAISGIAFKLGMLSVSGMIAAALTGGVIFAFGGISAAVLLMTFFVSGSLLGRLNRSKGERRDWKQVLANGFVPALAVIVIAFRHDLREEITLFFLGALATAMADTWATEIGTRFGKKFYNIFTFRPTHRGPSGAVSVIGLCASLCGALVIALLSLIRFLDTDPLCGLVLIKVIPVVTIAGTAGALLDSMIGATIQAKYTLPDESISEIKAEGAVLRSGIRFIGNNATNFVATLWGGVIAIWLGFTL